MLLDSHHHLWQYSAEQYPWISDAMEVLRADFGSSELSQIAYENEVDGFVSVQARQIEDETVALLQIADEQPLVRGVVGWVPLSSPDIGDTLDRLSKHSKLKAVRHVVQDEPDDRFLLGEDFNRGISQLKDHSLVYDILIFARQLPAAIEFVDAHPNQSFVLDHIAKPTITLADARENKVDAFWETHFRELAKRENVMCKFSGVVTEIQGDEWDDGIVDRYFKIALEAFSAQRLMFGSDWPVCLLKSTYSRWLRTVKTIAEPLSQDERDHLFAKTAIRAYNLSIT